MTMRGPASGMAGSGACRLPALLIRHSPSPAVGSAPANDRRQCKRAGPGLKLPGRPGL